MSSKIESSKKSDRTIPVGFFLRFYDDYINALATIKGEDAQGKTYRYIDEDLKAQRQLK